MESPNDATGTESPNDGTGTESLDVATGDLANFFRALRETTQTFSRPQTRWQRLTRRVGTWWKSLFLVRLWIACTDQIIRAVESSDPLSIAGNSGGPNGDDHKSRERLQRLIKTNQRLKLRRLIANWAIFFVIIQLACSNVFFALYLGKNEYTVAPPVMIAWLSACVIEVIGILIVIARSLFPRRDRGDKSDSTISAS